MIINGTKVEGLPKAAEVTVKGMKLNLNFCHIGETETVEAQFKWAEAPDGIVIESKKIGNRVATSISKGKTVVFEALTAQAAFQVMHAAFGWSLSKADSVYKKSNPLRKESKKATTSKVVVEAKEGVGL